MSDSTQPNDTQLQLMHFMAENESLKAQLEEYRYIIDTRNEEIDALKRKMGEVTQTKSNIDNQLEELDILQDHLYRLRQQAKGAADREMDLEKQLGTAVSTEHQLEDMQQQYTYLQTQLTDLQTRLVEMENRNLQLQQQTSQISELESLLEIVQRERDELKEKLAAES
ncbi:hypothetical protein [Ferruginibacter albus]|uniref:hypothetical protein n=1 Tax=Ferruginibacter albus TaxID=2875540 RepID=UPI001CC4137E|nr:hypothetical protein [Ferruginibacter albus]UAY52262.1 hypothetical protein K9M53_00875 [Ferruginibacter albus]